MNRSFLRRALLYLIILGGFALRLYRLGVSSLWYDETVSLVLARADIPELIRHTAGDIHPPLYYLLLHFWGRLAGWSEFSAAFLSLWFGVLLIATVYRVAREWFPSALRPSPLTPLPNISSRPSRDLPFTTEQRDDVSPQGRKIALLAALLVAISPYNVWYSQEVRMYTVGALLGLASVYFFRRMLHAHGQFTRDFFAYVLFTAAGFYTLYFFIFLIVFEYVYVALWIWQNKNLPSRFWYFALSQISVALIYLPWLPIAFHQATDPPVPPWRSFTSLPQVLIESFSALTFGQSVNPLLVAPLLLLLAALILYSLLSRPSLLVSQRETTPVSSHVTWNLQPERLFLLAYTFIPLLAIFLFSLWKPLYHVRYIFTYSPAFYILIALSISSLQSLIPDTSRAKMIIPAVYGLSLLATIYSLYNYWYNPQYAKDDLRGAVSFLADRWRPGDAVLVNAGYTYPALMYYWDKTTSDEPIFSRSRLTDVAAQESPSDPVTQSPNQVLLLQTGSIGGAPNLGWGDPLSDFYPTTAEDTRAALAQVFATFPRVWMFRLYDTVTDPDGMIRQYFADHAQLIEDQVFTGESSARVQGFITHQARDLPTNAVRVGTVLGERVELVGYETGTRELRAGEFFDAVLYWRLAQSVNYNYQVSLQLLNANGDNVAQFDEIPLSDLLSMTRWEVGTLYREPLRVKLPRTMPPGDYRAIVKLYNPRTLEVLGGVVELGVVQIR